MVVADTHHPDIIAMVSSETWFKSFSIVNTNDYNIFRNDRYDGRKGGGVFLFLKNSIYSYEFNDAVFNNSKIEQIWAVIYFNLSKYLIECIYRLSDFVDRNDSTIIKQSRDYVEKRVLNIY